MYTYAGLIFLAILIISAYYIIKALRNKYTKSRFAFLALTSISSVTFLIVLSLLSGQTPIQSVIGLLAQRMGWDYTPLGPNQLELVVLCFATWLLYSFCNSTFKNWDGPISVEQYRKSIRREENVLLIDGFNELKRILIDRTKEEIYEKELDEKPVVKLKTPDDSLAWHIQAYDLMTLVRSDLFFEPDSGWMEEESCWHGESKTTKDIALLYCSVDEVKEVDVSSLLKRSERYLEQKNHRAGNVIVVLATKEGTGCREIKVNGFDVCIYSEDALLKKLIDFKDYYYEICRRVEKEELPESNLTLLDTYETSDYTIEGDQKSRNNIETYLLEWLTDTSRRQVALLGEYGQGKSTLALMFAYRIIRNIHQDVNYIPVIIELRGKSPATMTPEEVLSSWSTNYQIKSTALKKLLISGRILLILEGFDEMAFLGDAETRINHFKTLWSLNYPKTKILITGRPNFFLDDNEMKNALGILDPVLGKSYCEAVHLSPFDINKISTSLRKYPKKTRDEIVYFAKKDRNFYDLASRPSILYLIAVLWEKENLSQYGENINSALIMGLFISYSYSRQHLKEQSSSMFMFLSERERGYFMSGVAAFMACNRFPNQIKGTTLRELVLKLLEAIPESVSLLDSAMQGGRRAALRVRINNEDNKLEQLQTDVRSCGILVRDISSPGTLKFAHKSFMEYLSAEVAARYICGNDEPSSILSEIDQSMYDLLSGEEIVKFFSELLKNVYSAKQQEKISLAEYLLETLAGKDKSKIIWIYKLRATHLSIRNINSFFHRSLAIMSFFLPYILLLISYRNILFKKRRLWEICCAMLNIPIEDMISLVGKGSFNILKSNRNFIKERDYRSYNFVNGIWIK